MFIFKRTYKKKKIHNIKKQFNKKKPKHHIFKVYFRNTLDEYKPNSKIKKNLKVAFFAFLKFNINLLKYFLPNILNKKNYFFMKFFSSRKQYILIKKKGKKVLKKRY